MEKQPPLGRAGVDIACQHLECLLLLLEFVGGFDDLLEGSRQPGESPDHQGVAGTHVFERGFEFQAITMRAGRFLDIEPLTPRLVSGRRSASVGSGRELRLSRSRRAYPFLKSS